MFEEYTLKLEDAGKTLEVNGENPNDQTEIVIPDHSTTPFPIGTQIKVYRGNEKVVFLRPSDYKKIVINSFVNGMGASSYYIPKFDKVKLIKKDFNKWILDKKNNNYLIFNQEEDSIFIKKTPEGVFRIHSYTNVGESEFRIIGNSNEIDILVVGGGGSGAATPVENKGGGGGAGGLVFVPNLPIEKKKYEIFVGRGGEKVGQETPFSPIGGKPGENSSFGKIITALGGGAGAQRFEDPGYSDGGSGGGGHYTFPGGQALQPLQAGFSGSPYGFGNDGATGTSHGQGGGGAGQAGFDQNITPVDGRILNGRYAGGNGLNQVVINSITYNFAEMFGLNFGERIGNEVWFAGGGGAGTASTGYNTYGAGGLGGGGRGAYLHNTWVGSFWREDSNSGEDAIPNTGGGGGGSRRGLSGRGGSGIILIRYRIG